MMFKLVVLFALFAAVMAQHQSGPPQKSMPSSQQPKRVSRQIPQASQMPGMQEMANGPGNMAGGVAGDWVETGKRTMDTAVKMGSDMASKFPGGGRRRRNV